MVGRGKQTGASGAPVRTFGEMIVDPFRTQAGPDLGALSDQAHSPRFISDHELFETFVTPQMMRYYQVKMPELSRETLFGRICELLKYLILVQFSPGRILFGREIDDVWHCWILQTRQYAQLCEKLPGDSFRHHSSNDYQETAEAAANTVSISDALQRALSFFISYYRNFGPMTNDRLACWPVLQQLAQAAEWDLEELNGFLHERAMLGSA
jgi:hypothetical protein